MTKRKPKTIKGRPSDVLKGTTKGGNVLLRLDAELHKRLARHCKRNGVSMNRFVSDLLAEALTTAKKVST